MVAAGLKRALARLNRSRARAVDWIGRRRRRVDEPHGLVLMYHRIARVTVDPWNLAVDPGHFESQVRVLHQRADIVPLAELHGRLRSGRRARPVVAITFDDAYLDNLEIAKPILERYEAPATVFVPTGLVGSGRAFWWDRLAKAVLGAKRLPRGLELEVAGDTFRWNEAAVAVPGRAGLRARRRLHDALWIWLHSRPVAARDEALARIEDLSDEAGPAPPDSRPMTANELRALTAGGLIEVGAHSVSHPLLTRLPLVDKAREIHDSRRQCTEWLGREPRAFAFPNGDVDDECVALVREAGFDIACTSQRDLAWASGDRLRTPRVRVPDLGGSLLLGRLRFEGLA